MQQQPPSAVQAPLVPLSTTFTAPPATSSADNDHATSESSGVDTFIVTAFPSYDDVLWHSSHATSSFRIPLSAPSPSSKSATAAHRPSLPRSELAASWSAIADSYSWRFVPIIQHPLVSRIARSTVHRVLLMAYLVFWFIAVSVLEISHPAVAVVCLVMTADLAIIALARIDYTLLIVLVQQFEMWYLAAHTLTFCAFGIWSMEDRFTDSFLASYFGCIVVAAVFILLFDTEVYASFFSKTAVLVVGVATAIQIWAQDHLATPRLASLDFCFLFCTDSARMALTSLTQLMFYYAKYCYKIVNARWRSSYGSDDATAAQTVLAAVGGSGRIHQFVTLRLPVMCSLQRILPKQGSARNDLSVDSSSASPSEALQVVRIEAVPPRELFASAVRHTAGSQCSLRVPSDDPSAASSASAASTSPARVTSSLVGSATPIVRLFRHKPVIQSDAIFRFATNTIYSACMVIYITLCIISISFPVFRSDGRWALIYLPVPVIVFLQLSHYDRTLMLSLFYRFETYVVSASIIQALIFGFWSADNSFHPAVLVSHCISTAVLFGFVCSFDASVACPTWIKVSTLALAIADTLTWLRLEEALGQQAEEQQIQRNHHQQGG